MDTEEEAVKRGAIDARYAHRYSIIRQGHRARLDKLEAEVDEELKLNDQAHKAALKEAGFDVS